MPSNTNNFPVLFNNEEMEFLKGSTLLDPSILEYLKETIEEEYNLIVSQIPEFKELISFHEYS